LAQYFSYSSTPTNFLYSVFKKNWLIHGDSIKEEESRIKEENWAGGVLRRTGDFARPVSFMKEN
jgi:hypothetical protein